MTKPEAKQFLNDFADLCLELEDATPDKEYYDLVKKRIRDFKKKHSGIWAEAFLALLRADIEEDIEAAKDPRGMTGAVWSTMDKVQTMIGRCYWGEDDK